MATTAMVRTKVEALTKYGFKADGKFVNYSKQFPESDKAKVVPGAVLEAEFYVADSGKEYLNKILSSGAAAPATAPAAVVSAPAVDAERAKKFVPKFAKKETPSSSMSKEEWQAKDRSQLLGGLSHDAAQLAHASAISGLSIDTVLSAYHTALDLLIQIRAEVK